MKVKVSYEPKGYAQMSNKRVIMYVLGGALGCIAIIAAMFYHHHKIDPVAVIVGLAIFAAVSVCGYVMKLNTRFCWNDDIFTVLNFTGNPEIEFSWDNFKEVYTNDSAMLMSLLFSVNGKEKEVRMNMKDDGVNDLLNFIRERRDDFQQTEDIK